MNTSPGFTLVESVTVIAIAGILGATALPRLAALGGEARYASLQTARSALSTVAVTAHGQFLINGRVTQVLEDVPLAMVEGYPAADRATADAAGLGKGYVVYLAGDKATATAPAVAPGSMAVVPSSIAGTPRARDCYLLYTQSRAPHAPPLIREGDGTNADSCA